MVFFYRGKRPGWQGLEQFGAVAAVREKDSGRHAGKIPGAKKKAALRPMEQIRAKVRPIEKN
ncbi:hypothetical protein [Paraburkholderia phytofirmans]|uniref:hypothetical protein n=1 Tax=Paraburkholderia phytofirmans TaxID=261302 RepID=UPI0011D12792|nr:hypothetical protein [Paraburkholderia phytofirmans]